MTNETQDDNVIEVTASVIEDTEAALVPVQESNQITTEHIEHESELRLQMVDNVRQAVLRENGTFNFGNKNSPKLHITNQALVEVAGYLSINVEFGEPEYDAEEKEWIVDCTATRRDGVSANAWGYCSQNEKKGSYAPFKSKGAALSMARVRALNALLLPFITQAMGTEVSSTPYEDMPVDYKSNKQDSNNNSINSNSGGKITITEQDDIGITSRFAEHKANGNGAAMTAMVKKHKDTHKIVGGLLVLKEGVQIIKSSKREESARSNSPETAPENDEVVVSIEDDGAHDEVDEINDRVKAELRRIMSEGTAAEKIDARNTIVGNGWDVKDFV